MLASRCELGNFRWITPPQHNILLASDMHRHSCAPGPRSNYCYMHDLSVRCASMAQLWLFLSQAFRVCFQYLLGQVHLGSASPALASSGHDPTMIKLDGRMAPCVVPLIDSIPCMTDATWITTAPQAAQLAGEIAELFAQLPDDQRAEIALDTESNSRFVYQEQVCLVQLNVAGKLYLIDTLAVDDAADLINPIRTFLEDPMVTVFLHGASMMWPVSSVILI